VAIVALVTAPRPTFAAQAPRVGPGSRVRFYAPGLHTQLTGTLVVWASDTLVLRVDGDAEGLRFMVPADSVSQLEVRHERRMPLEGLGIGLVGGTLLAVLASPDAVDDYGNCTTAACLAYKVSPHLDTRIAVLGGVGALVGLIVGSETRKVTWTPVQLERVDIGPAPGGGFAFGLRFSF